MKHLVYTLKQLKYPVYLAPLESAEKAVRLAPTPLRAEVAAPDCLFRTGTYSRKRYPLHP
mgnify:CR=1 FL=1